jgi:hypothetical protein
MLSQVVGGPPDSLPDLSRRPVSTQVDPHLSADS